LEHVSTSHPRAAQIGAWEKLRLARMENDKVLALESARAFADSVRSLPANLEWLGAAMSAGDRGGEIAARKTIAGAFSGEARSALLAGAALVSLIDSPGGSEPLLGDVDPASRLMNLELALPGGDGRRRASALFALGDALGEEARIDALLLAGYNHLAVGSASEALSCFD